MKYFLSISNFLEEISSLSHSVVFLYFFAPSPRKAFLSLLAILGTLHSKEYIFPLLICLSPLFFSQLFVRPPQTVNLILNLAIRSSWSQPQSAPGLVFADCIELLHLCCKEYNQSDFGIDHLVMSMCRVFSCVVGRGCLLWLLHSLGKTLLAFSCFILYSKAKFACYSRYFLTSYFCIPVPYNEKHIFWGVSSRISCRSF